VPRRIAGCDPVGSLPSEVKPMRNRRSVLSRVAGIGALALVAALPVAAAPAFADPGMVSVDTLRTAWDQNEPRLTPADASASDFGSQFKVSLTGQIYAQPIIASNVLIVGTESNDIYGLDLATGAAIWHRNVGAAWPASAVSCSDLTPTIGITSTPVYDSTSGYVYFTSKVNDGPDVSHPHWYLHAIGPTTGAERSGWPQIIQGSPSNDPTNTFFPANELQRPGLLVLGGVVYMGFGSHCDRGPYRGYVVGVSTGSGTQTAMWTTESGSGVSGAGIWQGGGGLVSDGAGRILFSTGNGASPPVGPGTTPPSTLSESVVRLAVQADGSLQAKDFFSPSDAPTLDVNDQDLGSGGPVALPDSFGTTSVPHLLVEQGKDGRVFLLNRDNLGGRSQGAGGTDNAVGVLGPYQGQWGHPAVWGGDGGYVYMVGAYGPLRAFRSGTTGAGQPALVDAGATRATFGYTTGSPIVTSNGTASGSATIWMVSASGPTGASGTLHAFNAVPDGTGAIKELYTAPIGVASKFEVPLSYNGRIYVGSRDGSIYSFGRPASSALTGTSTDFGSTALGSTTTASVTLTATNSLTITSASAGAPFGATSPASTVLAAGGTITIPVAFTPTSVGSSTGALSVSTSAGTFTFGLTGFGTSPGLAATPTSVSFDSQPTGLSKTVTVQLTNTGTTAESILGITNPAAPFTLGGVPTIGASVAAGTAFVVTVTYNPIAAGTDTGSFAIRTTSKTTTVPLTGTAVTGIGRLAFNPPTLDFGNVPVGASSTLSFTVTNDGTIPVTITKAKAPTSVFTSAVPMSEGLTVPAGGVVTQSVTFTPTATGTANDTYLISSDSGQGVMYEQIQGTGTSLLPAPSGGGWTLNTSAALSGTDLVLNPATASTRGSAVYPTSIPSSAFTATFTTSMGGGTGGDGLTFAMLDASAASPSSLGAGGAGLGLAGVPGVGVALKTTYTSAVASSNVAGVVTSTAGSTGLTWTAQKALGVNLRSGTHNVTVARSNGHLTVTVDATQVIDSTQTLPANVLFAFTGASGSKTDKHIVRNVTISVATGTVTTPPVSPLAASPPAVDFATVKVGTAAPASIVFTNTSSVSQTITGAKSPAAPFTATMPAIGLSVAAGGTVTVPVVYAPVAATNDSATLSVTTVGGTVTVPVTGAGDTATTTSTPIPSPSAGGWTLNGSASLGGTDLVLNPATASTRGSAIYPKAIPSAAFTTTFTTSNGGGTGGDGLTFAMLDASAASPTSLGLGGGGLGLAGLPGVGIALKTTYTTALNSSNVAGVVTSTTGATSLTWAAQTALGVNLRTSTHTITVTRAGGHLTVTVDGATVLDSTQALPANVYLAFTGASGSKTDIHIIRNATLSYG